MRVLLVDDHKLFTSGLRLLLVPLRPQITVRDAHSRQQALGFAGQERFDLILLDLYMPGNDAMDNLVMMRDTFDTACIVVVSGETDPGIILRTIEHGAAGFISKCSDQEEMFDALETVLSGGVYLPQKLIRRHGPRLPAPVCHPAQPPHDPLAALTQRQKDVLFSAIRGQTNKVIAREMKLSESSVKAHLAMAFRVLNVTNRTAALYEANRLHLLPAAAAGAGAPLHAEQV